MAGLESDDRGEVVVRRHDLAQVLVLALQPQLQARDLLERARAGDRGCGVVGEDAQDVGRRLREPHPHEHAEDAEDVLPIEERLTAEALDPLLAHPVRPGDVRVGRRVGHEDVPPLGDHGPHLERADRDAPEGAEKLRVELHRTPAGTDGAGGQVQALFARRARVRVAAGGARVAGPEQPDARECHALGALGDAPDDEREQRSEVAFERDLEQEIFQRVERRGSRLREEHRPECSSTTRDNREVRTTKLKISRSFRPLDRGLFQVETIHSLEWSLFGNTADGGRDRETFATSFVSMASRADSPRLDPRHSPGPSWSIR